ncbi:Gfo/Idh/MocA family protein [Streptomyces sp. HK10]|uniref:Gfo/Idh/MocA family protein n=1 Tax=Streptomyces sp. HK10 TaxID=3373255 RepID=UPI0037482688
MGINVALVGFGAAGRAHARALRSCAGVRVRGVWDRDPEVATEGLPRFPHGQAVLDDPDIHLVSLCLPPGEQIAMAVPALERGKAVLVEEPPTSSVGEFDELVALSRRYAAPLGVMLQHRMALPKDAYELAWNRSATAVLEVSGFRPTRQHSRPARTARELYGLHFFDLACQLLGDPATVHSVARRRAGAHGEMRVTGVVEFDSGIPLSFTFTSEAATQFVRLEILGPDARLLLADGTVSVECRDGRDKLTSPTEADLIRAVYEDMAQVLRGESAAPVLCGLDRSRGGLLIQGVLDSAPCAPAVLHTSLAGI